MFPYSFNIKICQEVVGYGEAGSGIGEGGVPELREPPPPPWAWQGEWESLPRLGRVLQPYDCSFIDQMVKFTGSEWDVE
jgi:hypothetical protein